MTLGIKINATGYYTTRIEGVNSRLVIVLGMLNLGASIVVVDTKN